MTEPNTGMWLVGGGVLAACWQYIKLVLWKVASLFIVRARLEAFAGDALLLYCWKNMKRSPFGERRYSTIQGFVRPVSRYLTIGYERLSRDSTIFWMGVRPLALAYQESKREVDSDSVATTVTFLRFCFDLDKLLISALELYNQEAHEGMTGFEDSYGDPEYGKRYVVERQFGYGSKKGGSSRDRGRAEPSKKVETHIAPEWRLLRWLRSEVGANESKEPMSGLAFPAGVEDVVERCRRWKRSEKWYKEKQIAWRYGVTFYGKPGTGKTSLARAIAQDLDLPVISFDLGSYGNEDFVHAWRELMSRAPCMALFEDIDAVFQGRENRLGEDGGGLSFDCFLNCLSGIESSDGVLVVVTTNRVEDLDEALGIPNDQGVSTRPGRVDTVVELKALDESCRQRIAERILVDCPEEIDDTVRAGDGETGAQFSDRCAKIALAHYWEAGMKQLIDSRGVMNA